MSLFKQNIVRIVFLCAGAGIVLLSFFSANTIFSQGDSLKLAQKKLYIEKEVLPDHLLYPVFMTFDRVQLELTPEDKKADLQISYGWQRLEATHRLLEKGYQALSFTTLTKAYKYQNAGLNQAGKSSSYDQKQKARFQAEKFMEEVSNITSSFTDAQQEELRQLQHEQEILLQTYF